MHDLSYTPLYSMALCTLSAGRPRRRPPPKPCLVEGAASTLMLRPAAHRRFNKGELREEGVTPACATLPRVTKSLLGGAEGHVITAEMLMARTRVMQGYGSHLQELRVLGRLEEGGVAQEPIRLVRVAEGGGVSAYGVECSGELEASAPACEGRYTLINRDCLPQVAQRAVDRPSVGGGRERLEVHRAELNKRYRVRRGRTRGEGECTYDAFKRDCRGGCRASEAKLPPLDAERHRARHRALLAGGRAARRAALAAARAPTSTGDDAAAAVAAWARRR